MHNTRCFAHDFIDELSEIIGKTLYIAHHTDDSGHYPNESWRTRLSDERGFGMILTVTPNAALDRVIFIDEFQPGTNMRATRMVDYVGGKGLDASVALRTFQIDTLGLSFVGGSAGQALAKLLDGYGIRHDLVWLEGELRIAHVVVETHHHRHSHIIGGALPVPPEAAAELLRRYQTHLPSAAWVIAGGSLAPRIPVSYYRTMTEMAHAAGIPILIDSSGPSILEVISARPAILKMNRTEFNQTFKVSALTLSALRVEGQALREREFLPALVLTNGPEGILALTSEGSYQAVAPVQQAINAAGAGDTVSAMLTWRFSLGDSWPDALHWAAAASAASVLAEGTGESRRADVERLFPQVEVQRLDPF
jgi:1-phosphofructokinase family hexose kinase